MKKIFTPLVATALFAASCQEDNGNPSRLSSDTHLLKKVLNFRNSTDTNPYGFVEYEYDASGNLIKESLYDYPNTLTTYALFTYENSRLAEKRIYEGQVGNLQLGTNTQYFYTQGKVTEEKLLLADGTWRYSTHFEYQNDRLMKTYKTDEELGVHHEIRYQYDNANRLIREESYMYEQELDGFTKYHYDSNGRLKKTEHFDHHQDLVSYLENSYEGDEEQPREELRFDKNGTLLSKKNFSYDARGNLVETNVEENGAVNTTLKRKYNGDLIIEEITYHPYFGYTEWTVARFEYQARN